MIKSEQDKMSLLERLGFNVVDYQVLQAEDVPEHFKVYQEGKRDQLDYPIDGMVVKIDDLLVQNSFGYYKGTPRGCRAIKFQAKLVETEVIGIRWQFELSHRMTPVLELNPTFVNTCGGSGVTLRHCSCYNVDFLRRLGIWIGDGSSVPLCKISIQFAGDIIPQPIAVLNPQDSPLFA